MVRRVCIWDAIDRPDVWDWSFASCLPRNTILSRKKMQLKYLQRPSANYRYRCAFAPDTVHCGKRSILRLHVNILRRFPSLHTAFTTTVLTIEQRTHVVFIIFGDNTRVLISELQKQFPPRLKFGIRALLSSFGTIRHFDFTHGVLGYFPDHQTPEAHLSGGGGRPGFKPPPHGQCYYNFVAKL